MNRHPERDETSKAELGHPARISSPTLRATKKLPRAPRHPCRLASLAPKPRGALGFFVALGGTCWCSTGALV